MAVKGARVGRGVEVLEAVGEAVSLDVRVEVGVWVLVAVGRALGVAEGSIVEVRVGIIDAVKVLVGRKALVSKAMDGEGVFD